MAKNGQMCRACDAKRHKKGKDRSAYIRAWKERNRAHVLAYSQRPEVKARRAAAARAYRRRHPDRVHGTYQRRRARALAYRYRRYWSDPERFRAEHRRYYLRWKLRILHGVSG